MQKAIIGKKIGMTQIFDEAGKVIPVTVVEAGPCVVIQKKTTENDGYEAVQLGFGDVTTKHVTKPMQGHFAKADVAAKKTLKEFRLADCADPERWHHDQGPVRPGRRHHPHSRGQRGLHQSHPGASGSQAGVKRFSI